MTKDLATAMHRLADSGQPPAMDVERVLREGRQSLVRRRTAALSGGTAVLAVTGLAIAALAPAGSLGDRRTAPAATTPAPATTGMGTLAPAVDPHDPILTRYQYGYLPEGMRSDGGADDPGHRNEYSWSTIADSASSDFELTLSQLPPGTVILPRQAGKSGVIEHVPAVVPGATQAFWLGYGGGNIVSSTPDDGEGAQLVWLLPGGEWLTLTASHLQELPDWKEQMLKAAAAVIRQDKTVPMPITIPGELVGKFELSKVSVTRVHGQTVSHLELDTPSLPLVNIVAYDPRAGEVTKRVAPFGGNKTCKDSNGLTVCVTTTDTPPESLTAIGGPQALLNRITSVGNDLGGWTQDVLQ